MQTVAPRQGALAPEATAADVQAHVEKILASPGFARSERHSKLLRHLVSMSLAGRGGDIKEYVLGVELFGRRESFDPQTDAIVRTEVSRLRAKLKAYYNADGRDDFVIIELPARGYAPVFKSRGIAVTEAGPPPLEQRRAWLWILPGLLVAGSAIFYASYAASRASPGITKSRGADEDTSVAVLPFVNSDRDPELEQFADGLTEEAIETLAEIDGIRVVPRTSVFQFKGKQEDLRSVAAKLHVGAVLEGAVRRSGKNLRITVRLVNALEGYQYYSHVYEHELKDAFGIQREIAAQLANVLRTREKGQEVAQFTKSAEARRIYQQGLYHSSRISESELRQAIECHQRAIGYDANYSPAYTSLAEAYITLALLNEAASRESMRRAADAARAAVRTNETFAHAHAALGSVLALFDWDWTGAEKEFRRAVDEDPNDPEILRQYAMRYLAPQGNLDSALFELQLAQHINPFSPRVILNRGQVQYFKRDPAQALRDIHAALELDPELELGARPLAEAYMQSSSFDQALRTLQGASAPTEDEARLAVLGRLYALSGQPERARQVLEQLTEVDRHQRISGYYFSQVHLALGERSRALDWLEKAAEEHSPLIVYVKVAPQFDSLRGDPRFHALLKRIGLAR